MTVVPQLADVDFRHTTSFQCPIFFFAGRDDRTTPASLVETYFASIQAPQKKLFVVDRAAHYVFDERPGEFLVDLVRDIRPLAPAQGD
jgi:pimeloyl-ACP methyl ester carboxylesterase